MFPPEPTEAAMAIGGSPSIGVLPDLPVPLLVSIKKFERPPTPRYHGRPYCLLCADAGTILPKSGERFPANWEEGGKHMYGVHQLPGAHAVFAPRRDENHVHSYYGNSHESLRIMFEKDWAHILQVTEFRESIRAAAELILGGGPMQGLAAQMGNIEVHKGQGGEDKGGEHKGGEDKGGEDKEYPRRMSSVFPPPTPNVIGISTGGGGEAGEDIVLSDDEVATGEVLLRHYGVINNIYNYYAAENVQRDSFSMQLDEFRDLINDCEIDPRVKAADIFRQTYLVSRRHARADELRNESNKSLVRHEFMMTIVLIGLQLYNDDQGLNRPVAEVTERLIVEHLHVHERFNTFTSDEVRNNLLTPL